MLLDCLAPSSRTAPLSPSLHLPSPNAPRLPPASPHCAPAAARPFLPPVAPCPRSSPPRPHNLVDSSTSAPLRKLRTSRPAVVPPPQRPPSAPSWCLLRCPALLSARRVSPAPRARVSPTSSPGVAPGPRPLPGTPGAGRAARSWQCNGTGDLAARGGRCSRVPRAGRCGAGRCGAGLAPTAAT